MGRWWSSNITSSCVGVHRPNLAASYTERIVSAITKKVGMALERESSKKLILAGGVAANSHLRSALEALCAHHGATLYAPPISLCGDNAAMIAAAGYYEYLDGNLADTSLNASASDDGK